MRRTRRLGRGTEPPLENHKAIGFLSNTVLEPMENHKNSMLAHYWPAFFGIWILSVLIN